MEVEQIHKKVKLSVKLPFGRHEKMISVSGGESDFFCLGESRSMFHGKQDRSLALKKRPVLEEKVIPCRRNSSQNAHVCLKNDKQPVLGID